MEANLLFFFSALGAFHGLIAGVYLFFFPSKKTLSTYLFGALLVVLSIRVGKSVAYLFDYNISKSVLQAGLTACLFIGPFLYFFVRTQMEVVPRMPFAWKIQLIAWLTLIVVVGAVFPYENIPILWTQWIIPAIYLQWGIYQVLTLVALQPLLAKIRRREPLRPGESWTLAVVVAIVAIFVVYVWAYARLWKASYVAAPLSFSLVTYALLFVFLYRRKGGEWSVFNRRKQTDDTWREEEAPRIAQELQRLMQERHLYLNPELKVEDVARELGIPAHQLSRVLNEKVGKNFTSFVNEYRVEAACTLLLRHRHLTIEGIGSEVGFHSKSTFFTAFKKVKGRTPAAYVKEITPDS